MKKEIQAAPIVAGQEVFSPEQMQLLLGGISRASYFRICPRDGSGPLRFSRIDKGRQAVHTIEQYRDYVAYLNSEGVVGEKKSDIADWKRTRRHG